MTISISTEELASAIIRMSEGQGKRNAAGLYIPFQDGGGVWTIGKGHTHGVTEHTPPATQQQVDKWFTEDQAPLFQRVTHMATLEAAAWVSFGYNCGIVSMLACMKAGVEHVKHYVHDHKGNIEPGLVVRREREYFLILLSRMLTPIL